jgi:uncharacterized protein
MKRLILIASFIGLLALILVLGGLAFSSGATATADTGASVNSTGLITLPGVIWSQQSVGLWVSGEGKVSAVPDIASLSLGVEVQKKTLTEAQQQAATSMSAVMSVLKSNNVADVDIQTQEYSITPVWQYNSNNGSQTLIGYKVDNNIIAKIRNLNNVGKIIDAAATAAGNDIRINGISFSIDNTASLNKQARDLALKDAMAKAQQIAATTGVKLGNAIYIAETSPTVPFATPSFAQGAVSAPVTTPISSGTLEITIDVQMVFNINQ